MQERSWTIGSLPDCDIRVESPTVSGRHCRLTQRGHLFLLEDLASTNGTYVAGERIDRPWSIRRGDKITLGLGTPMPWPILSSITVGRLADNDVVIPLDMVSGHHARLEREGDRVFLVDLESSNGTSLNDPLKKIRRAAIQPADVVFLGTHAIRAADLLAALPEDSSDAEDVVQDTNVDAQPPVDLLAELSSPVPAFVPAPAPRKPAVSLFDSYRSVRSWALGIGLSVACILATAALSRTFHAGAKSDNHGAVHREANRSHASVDK
jgi:pSer/pThr/pTyr-binding forkhead associated (FHA) protein